MSNDDISPSDEDACRYIYLFNLISNCYQHLITGFLIIRLFVNKSRDLEYFFIPTITGSVEARTSQLSIERNKELWKQKIQMWKIFLNHQKEHLKVCLLLQYAPFISCSFFDHSVFFDISEYFQTLAERCLDMMPIQVPYKSFEDRLFTNYI